MARIINKWVRGQPISRAVGQLEVEIQNAAALSDEIDLGGAREFMVVIPSTWTNANLGFQVSEEAGGTFVPLYDDGGNLVQIAGIAIAASRAYVLPPEVGVCQHIKLWSQNGAGVSVNQGAKRTIQLTSKG